jgi:hypothetical protein
LPEATNVGGKSIFCAQAWLRKVALIRRFARKLRYSFQSIFQALSIVIRRPRGLGRKIFGTPKAKLRRSLVLKTTIEKVDASIFSVGVGASRSVLSVVHFERHERAGSFRNEQFGRGAESSEILFDSRFALHPVTNGSFRAHSFV